MTGSTKELNTSGGKNRFKFKSFRDQLESLSFDVIHRIERQDDDIGESGSHFNEALERWAITNGTSDFNLFLKEARNYSKSLPQILYHKKDICSLINTHLETEVTLSLEPILNLIPSLARDLQDEFYPHFIEIYPRLSSLLTHKDAKVIEWSFNALAYSFKYLSKIISKNLIVTFKLIAPLLEAKENRQYLRHFAAESFGFLVRRAKGPQLKLIIQEILLYNVEHPSEAVCQGLDSILLESMRNVGNHLHSQAPFIMKEVFSGLFKLGCDFTSSDLSCANPLFKLCSNNITSLCHYARKQHIRPLFSFIEATIQQATFTNFQELALILGVCNSFIEYKEGSCVLDYKPFFFLAQKASYEVFSKHDIPLILQHETMKLIALLFTQSNPTDTYSKGKELIEFIFRADSVKHSINFSRLLIKLEFDQFSSLILPVLTRSMSKVWNEFPEQFCLLLLNVLQHTSSNDLIQFSTSQPIDYLIGLLNVDRDWGSLLSELDGSVPNIGLVSAALTILSSYRIAIKDDLFEPLCSIYKSLLSFLINPQTVTSSSSRVLGESLLGQVINTFSKSTKSLSYIWEHFVLKDLLSQFSHSKPILLAIARIANSLKIEDEKNVELFSQKQLDEVYSHIIHGFSSHDPEVRVACCEIMSCYETEVGLNEFKQALELCIAVDKASYKLNDYRMKLAHLRKLAVLAASGDLLGYDVIVPGICLGTFAINLTPLWTDATKTLLSLTKIYRNMGTFLIDALESIFMGTYTQSHNIVTQLNDELSQNIHLSENPDLNDLITLLLPENGQDLFGIETASCQLQSIIMPYQDRLDQWNIAKLILTSLTDMPQLAESHGDIISKRFITLHHQFVMKFSLGSTNDLIDDGEDELDEGDNDVVAIDESVTDISQPICQQVILFLDLMAKFRKPQTLQERKQLESIYEDLLLNSFSQIQLGALSCLESYRYPFLVQYSHQLRDFLDASKIREQLVLFPINQDTIDADHRSRFTPYLIRILFGRLFDKRGHRVNKAGFMGLLKNIFFYLGRLLPYEIGIFVSLFNKPFQPLLSQAQPAKPLIENYIISVSYRQQRNYLVMLDMVFKQLGSRLQPHYHSFLIIILNILNYTTKSLGNSDCSSNLKQLRILAFRRLLEAFNSAVNLDFNPYMVSLFSCAISPRLERLSVENTQGPSALLELFLSWSKLPSTVFYLVDYDQRILPNLYLCMSSPHCKPAVVGLITEIIENILKLSEEAMEENCSIMDRILIPDAGLLLDALETVLSKAKNESVLLRNALTKKLVFILSKMAEFARPDQQSTKLLSMLTSALFQPSKVIDDYEKRDIMIIVSKLVKLAPELQSLTPEFYRHYEVFSRLLFKITLRESRQALLEAFRGLANADPRLGAIMDVMDDLNSFSEKRLDEPNFERRLKAFNQIHDSMAPSLTAHQWYPLLFNFFYYLNDSDEMSMRNSGSFGLIKFMECATLDVTGKLMVLVSTVIFPTIKKGIKSRYDVCRAEFIMLLGHAVSKFRTSELFKDLAPLLGKSGKQNEEERDLEVDRTDFFTGICHIQKTRKVAALVQLSAYLNKARGGVAPIRSTLLSSVLVPIVTDLLYTNTDNNATTFEAIRALSAISRHLSWGAYYLLFRQNFKLLVSNPVYEDTALKIVLSIAEGFHFDISAARTISQQNLKQPNDDLISDDEEENDEIGADVVRKIDVKEDGLVQKATADFQCKNAEHIAGILTQNIIPDLISILDKCPEEKIANKIPVALIAARLIKKLPFTALNYLLPSLLMKVGIFLRSRKFGLREIIRATLIKITKLLGPSHFLFIVKELRSTLNKGYMNHVLGYTIYELLIALLPDVKAGRIDHVASELMEVIIEEMFGDTGREKESQDYSGKVKEAYLTKSHLTLEVLVGVIKLESLGIILGPLKQILSESESADVLEKMDQALMRIILGLSKNTESNGRALLTLCYGLIEQNLNLTQKSSSDQVKLTQQEITYQLDAQRIQAQGKPDHFANNGYKLAQFGLNLLYVTFVKIKKQLTPDEVIQLMNPFVPLISEALYSNHQHISMHAINILRLIMNIPLPDLELGLPVMIKRIMALVYKLNSTRSELVQASFRLLIRVIRNKSHSTNTSSLSNPDLQILLEMIRPDLEEPSQQGMTFDLIQAVISRKLLVSALYDIVDDISRIMITNQTEDVRALCRQVYVRFLLEYPQGAPRVEKQMSFLVSNLSYCHETGRESTMEVLNVLFEKISPEILNDYSEAFFMGLSMTLVNDDSGRCREMAGALLRALINRINEQKLVIITRLVLRWSAMEATFSAEEVPATSNNSRLKRMGLQIIGFMIEGLKGRFKPLIGRAITRIITGVEEGLQFLEQAKAHQISLQEMDPELDVSSITLNTNWEIPYYALHTYAKLIHQFPEEMISVDSLWNSMTKIIVHPHQWVRSVALRLVDSFFMASDPVSLKLKESDSPHHFLTIDSLFEITKQLCILQKAPTFDDKVGQQWVKNMFFISKAFYAEHTRFGDSQPSQNDQGDAELLESSDSEDDELSKDQSIKGSTKKRPLRWLISRCSNLARSEIVKTNAFVRKSYIFQLFAAIVNLMDSDHLSPFLTHIMSPLLRVLQDPIIKAHAHKFTKLTELTNQVHSFVKQKAAPKAYMDAITAIETAMREKRSQRHEKQAQLAMNDPETFATIKLAKKESRKAALKRKTKDVSLIKPTQKRARIKSKSKTMASMF